MLVVEIVLSLVGALLLLWMALIVVMAVARPDSASLAQSARILPDTIRLVRRLTRDPSVGRSVQVRLWLLLAYLASPIDLIPDFVPVVGYADDAVITGLVLRSVVKRAGAGSVQQQWPGTPDGLAMLARLCRLPELAP